MRLITLMLTLAFSATAYAQDPGASLDLKMGGSCPGDAAIGIRSFVDGMMTGSGPFVLVAGLREGSTVVPGGDCSGTRLGVESDGVLLKFGPVADLDRDGMIDILPTLPPSVCGLQMQAIDLSNCEVSNVMSLESISVPEPLGRCACGYPEMFEVCDDGESVACSTDDECSADCGEDVFCFTEEAYPETFWVEEC